MGSNPRIPYDRTDPMSALPGAPGGGDPAGAPAPPMGAPPGMDPGGAGAGTPTSAIAQVGLQGQPPTDMGDVTTPMDTGQLTDQDLAMMDEGGLPPDPSQMDPTAMQADNIMGDLQGEDPQAAQAAQDMMALAARRRMAGM